MTILLSATLLFLLACPCAANEEDSDQKKSPEKRYNEAFYQNLWCEEFGGETEVRLPDKTRCDCLTEEYAIEFDFAKKWCEAVGQSLHYARLTEKKAGIVLIIGQDPSKREKDLEYLERLRAEIAYFQLPIKVWTTSRDELSGTEGDD